MDFTVVRLGLLGGGSKPSSRSLQCASGSEQPTGGLWEEGYRRALGGGVQDAQDVGSPLWWSATSVSSRGCRLSPPATTVRVSCLPAHRLPVCPRLHLAGLCYLVVRCPRGEVSEACCLRFAEGGLPGFRCPLAV